MIQRCLILLLTVLCLGASNVSARVCFLPDAEDCGQGDTNMPEANSTVIPCDHKDCKDTSWYNKTHEDCYTSGVCAYKRCRLTQEKCEKTRQKDEECKLDVGTGCYYTQKIDKCSSLYNRTQNDIHGDCKECVDKQGSHWYCQYDNCNDLYPGSSSNPTCTDGTTKKQIGTSINEGACYICSIDPNSETCDTYQDEEKVGIDRGCWECKPCPSDRSKFQCTENIREGYEIKNGVCQISSQTQTCKQQKLVAQADCDTTTNTFTENKSVAASDAPCGTCTSNVTKRTYTVYVNDDIVPNDKDNLLIDTGGEFPNTSYVSRIKYKRTVTSDSPAAILVFTSGIKREVQMNCLMGEGTNCVNDKEIDISNGRTWGDYSYDTGLNKIRVYYRWNKMDISINGTKYTVSDSLNGSSNPCVNSSVEHENATYNIVCRSSNLVDAETCKTGTAKVWIVYYAGHQVNNQCTADYNIGYLSQYAAKLSNGTNNVEVYATYSGRPVSISITSSTKPYYIIQNTNWTLTSQAPVAYLLTKETFDSYVQAKGASFDINGANPSLSCPKFLIGDISSYKQSANISCAGEYVILVGYPSSDNSSGRVPDIGDKMEL